MVKTAGKINYHKAFSENMLLEAQAFAAELSQNYSEKFTIFGERARKIYKNLAEIYPNDSKLA
ncbi:MAG: hypothetical protein ACFBSE_11350, partial [Prochloraceae cyanobacterium]